MKLSAMKIDSTKQEQGDWVDNIPELLGVRFKTRGMNNKAWRKMSQTLMAAVPRVDRIDGIGPDHQDRINGQLLRETAILDWDGIEGDDGKPLPYSKEAFAKIWNDPDMQLFRDGALWAASIVAQRRAGNVEADAKN